MPHTVISFVSFYSSSIVKNILQTAEGIKHYKKKKMKQQHLRKFKKVTTIFFLSINKGGLHNLRAFAIIIFVFCCFLRNSETLYIRRSDSVLKKSYEKIFTEKSKSDVCRIENWLYVDKEQFPFSPLQNLKRHLNFAKIIRKADEFIFRSITSHQSHQ